MPEESLKNKTVKGTFWSAADNIARYTVTFAVGIVLARILSPDDYGLIGIIGIFTAVCDALINGGYYAALIRKKDATEDDFNTVFFINLVTSIYFYLIIYLCAPVIADFFGREELIWLTRVSSITMIIGALGFVQTIRLTKRIDFKSQTKITLVASIVSGIMGIALAINGCGVWALVAQTITSQVIKVIMLTFYNRWIPKFTFSKTSFFELFGFGWKLMVSKLLDNVWKELYQVVVGKFYSPATLGQYTRAKGFSQLFSSNLTDVVQRVSFPVLSNIQDEKERMIAAYRRIIKTTMFITFIAMFSLAAVSGPLIYCLIGPQWNDAAMYLPVICLCGSLYPLHAINLNMLQLQGRSDLFLVLEVVKKIISLGPLFVGAFVGIMPMLYSSIITGIICYFLNSYFPGKLLGYTSWMQIKDCAPSFGIALIIATIVWPLRFIPASNWVILLLQIILGIASFFAICKITGIQEYFEVREMVKPILSKFKIYGRG